MQARRAARELALILLSQLDKQIKDYTNEDFEEVVLKSVRTLTNNATEELSIVTSEFLEIKDYLETYEKNHPDNLERPIDARNIPVKFDMTDVMQGRIDTILSAIEKTTSALEIAEIATLSSREDVKEYILKIAHRYKVNSEAVDDLIKKYAIGWEFDRIFKIDKNILRIAITELLFIKDAPHKVVIDEALELAKKYSTDDSSSFINGILAKIVGMQNV
ncbi:transcription antitermination factor NusB [bacterium]|nr:transcription antitermination factor NusB [bacterium]